MWRLSPQVILALLIPVFAGSATADAPVSGRPVAPGDRPRIGLVLAGGGALGFAHVGVLKVLERERIPVDIVTGTSMGSIVGAAYAAGRSVDEMESILTGTDWEDVFSESPSRRDLPYRLKAGRDREIFGDTKFGFKNGKLVLPTGALQGQKIFPMLQRLYDGVPNPVSFDELPLQYRAVAADIETGKAVVLSEGDLATAARASMSVPGVFAPVEIGDRLLVDGGIANNLPVNVARELGAERLIVVELFADLKKRAELDSPLAITGQIISMLLDQNAAIQRASLTNRDVLITPNLEGYSSTSFTEAQALFERGQAAAEAVVERLRPWAVSEAEYARYQSARLTAPSVPAKIEFVEVRIKGDVEQGLITPLLEQKEGATFSRDAAERDVGRIMNLGLFSSARYEQVVRNGTTGVVYEATGKEYLKNYLRVGATLETDLNGESSYALSGAFRMTERDGAGAYTEAIVSIGESPRFSLEYYRPLSDTSPWFIAPQLQYARTAFYLRNGDETVAEYLQTAGDAVLRFGRQLTEDGEVTVGLRRGFGDFERHVGDAALPEPSFDTGDAFFRAAWDDLDDPDFPTVGSRANLLFASSLEELGASDAFNALSGAVAVPFTGSLGTFSAGARFASSFQDLPVERSQSLGGFLNLSGYTTSSVATSDYVIGNFIYYRPVTQIGGRMLGLELLAGASLEVATIQNDDARLEDEDLLVAGSVFAGVDTPLLPLYLAWGMAEEGVHSLYLVMGRVNPGRR